MAEKSGERAALSEREEKLLEILVKQGAKSSLELAAQTLSLPASIHAVVGTLVQCGYVTVEAVHAHQTGGESGAEILAATKAGVKHLRARGQAQ